MRDEIIKSTSTEESSTNDDGDEETKITCPLFMDGLPSDFQNNSALAAIASLMNDDDDDDDDDRLKSRKESMEEEEDSKRIEKTRAGGGKLSRNREKNSKRSQPYTLPGKKKKSSSMGEATVFMKLWKI